MCLGAQEITKKCACMVVENRSGHNRYKGIFAEMCFVVEMTITPKTARNHYHKGNMST